MLQNFLSENNWIIIIQFYTDVKETVKMILKLNDKEIEFAGNTLLELMDDYGFMEKTGIAIAVNETVVPRTDWKNHMLKQKDTILIITPAQGG
jgi:sulfur carrier protein